MASHFWRNVVEVPDQAAFADCADEALRLLSWSELGQRAADAVRQLQADGWKPGEHIASCLPNSLAWILLDIASQTLGLVHVAIDPRESPPRQQQLYEFSQARQLISDRHWPPPTSSPSIRKPINVEECLELAGSVAVELPTQILFTSGSLAEPKGVMLSHRNLVSNSTAKLAAAPQYASDLRLNVLPFAHAYARTCELTSWILTRSRLVVVDSWLELLRVAPHWQPTLLNVVPYLAQQAAQVLDANPQALGSQLRLLQCGGAALPTALWQRLASHGLPPLQGYGLTEASPVVCSNIAGRQQPASVGPAVAGVQLRLDSQQVLWCRGPNVMLGYWRDAVSTQRSLKEGWLCTGDLAHISEAGVVSILGRASQQLILSSGYKVSPEAVERELLAVTEIAQAVVLGDARPYVVALIWPSEAFASSSELRCKIAQQLSHLPRYATPLKFSIMTEPLSPATGTLTHKGTFRRPQIAQRYQSLLSQLYAS